MKKNLSLILNIILIIIILFLLVGFISKSKETKDLQEQYKQLAENYDKQLEDYAKTPADKDTISDMQFQKELRRRNVFAFKNYKGKTYKHLNTAYKYVINKNNKMIHKVIYPGGSAAYATGIENRIYGNDLRKYPASQYKYCSYCFPNGPPPSGE